MNECYLYTLNKESSSLCVEALHEAVNMTITSGVGGHFKLCQKPEGPRSTNSAFHKVQW